MTVTQKKDYGWADWNGLTIGIVIGIIAGSIIGILVHNVGGGIGAGIGFGLAIGIAINLWRSDRGEKKRVVHPPGLEPGTH